jgi:hypothetical protein
MLLDAAKPAALLLCVLSLCALFHAAFLAPGTVPDLLPGSTLYNRILDFLPLFALSSAICIVSGLLFRETEPEPRPSLSATFPVQIFYWTIGIMSVLFIVSWYLETHCIFYRATNW